MVAHDLASPLSHVPSHACTTIVCVPMQALADDLPMPYLLPDSHSGMHFPFLCVQASADGLHRMALKKDGELDQRIGKLITKDTSLFKVMHSKPCLRQPQIKHPLLLKQARLCAMYGRFQRDSKVT